MFQDRFLKYVLILIAILYVWDIGNIYAPRQGTEALYMQVSQEMHESQNFQVPHYRGERHWSKPPLHFWMPQLVYDLVGEANLTFARGVIALLCFVFAFLTAQWVTQYLSLEFGKTFFFFVGTLGLLKFSRVYLMEISLTFMPFLSSLYFFSFLKERRNLHFLFALVLSALAILLKGPVSIVMTGVSVLTYAGYLFSKNKTNIFKESLLVGFLSILIGGIWYLINYLNFGSEFSDYFFLRENLGKFGSQKHSPIKIFQGLLVYSYPLILFLPLCFKEIVDKIKKKDNFTIFLFIHFFVFFGLWFIPSQRSSQYAMPSIPYLLLLILMNLSTETLKGTRYKIIKSFTAVITFSILLFSLILLYFTTTTTFIKLIFPVVFISMSLIFLMKNQYFKSIVTQFLTITFLWSVSISSFFLPYIPVNYISEIRSRPVALVSRRSYYFEEILQHKVEPLPDYKIRKFLTDNQPAYAIAPDSLMKKEYSQGFKVLAKWPKWKRRIKWKDISLAIKKRDLVHLQEQYRLYTL